MDCSGKFWVDRERTAACVCVRVGREGLEGSSRDPSLRCVKASCYVIWGGVAIRWESEGERAHTRSLTSQQKVAFTEHVTPAG